MSRTLFFSGRWRHGRIHIVVYLHTHICTVSARYAGPTRCDSAPYAPRLNSCALRSGSGVAPDPQLIAELDWHVPCTGVVRWSVTAGSCRASMVNRAFRGLALKRRSDANSACQQAPLPSSIRALRLTW